MSASLSSKKQFPLVLSGTYTEPPESHSEGIYVYRMNPFSGELTFEAVIKDMPNVSFMATHPKLGLIYAVNETQTFKGRPGGGVSVLSKGFHLLNDQSSGGKNPCYISIEQGGRFALVANYESGSVAMLPIESGGRLRPASDVVQHVGSSVHPERQTGPHPHCIIPDRTNRFAIAVDLGMDKLLIYRMDLDAGKLRKHAEVQVEAGAGPRHLIFNSSGQYAYVINELNSTVIVYRYDSETGIFDPRQTISTLPEKFSDENYCADIHFSPDEKHLYISNRGHDSIVCFKVNSENGELAYHSYVSSNGHFPRIFALDPSGHFMIAVHQKSNTAVVFQVNSETGTLSQTGYEAHLDIPVHVLFVK